MKEVKIFVAGSKALQEHRHRLITLANDMNVGFSRRSRGIHLTMLSYENFGDNQEAYNSFIQDEAEITIFIIEDRLGEKTQAEFLLACRGYDRNKHPHVLTFVKQQETPTKEFSRIEGVVTGASNNYYHTYTSLDDLAIQARKRLDEYLDNKYPVNRSKAKRSLTKGFSKWTGVLLGFICALIISTVFFAIKSSRPEKPVILVGGGSAYNCLTFNYGDFSDYLYIDMPTLSAEFVLEESLISEDNDNMKYYPVCLSGTEANDSSFMKTITNHKDFINKGRVISHSIGIDTLVVYTTEELANQLFKDGIIESTNSIRITELAYILEKHESLEINTFSTTPNSATRKEYGTYLKEVNCQIDSVKKLDDFHKGTQMDIFDASGRKGRYMVLCSARYTAKAIENDKRLIVCKDNNEPATKEAFIYILARKHSERNLEIPKDIEKLMSRLGMPVKQKIKNHEAQQNSSGIIIPFDELINIEDWK